MEEKSRTFDEVAKECAQYILESLDSSGKRPEIIKQIRRREHVLKNFFLEKLGLNLICPIGSL